MELEIGRRGLNRFPVTRLVEAEDLDELGVVPVIYGVRVV